MPLHFNETARIAVGSHPNEMIWAKDGRLFVADSGSNQVSVIADSTVVETITTSLDPNAPVGSTPDALAISPDGRRLYVANADNNNVAVIDVSGIARSRGCWASFPPAGIPLRSPSRPTGNQLYVGTGKGMGFRNNYPGRRRLSAKAPDPKTPYDYIAAVLTGHVSIVDVPDARQLAAYTKQAMPTFPRRSLTWIPRRRRRSGRDVFPKIKHVLYIIRENRTYDQVFGDLGVGQWRSQAHAVRAGGDAQRARAGAPHCVCSTTFTAMAKSPKMATNGRMPPMPPTSTRRRGRTVTATAASRKPTSA